MNLNVLIITDGACSGNPGPGGFGIIIRISSSEQVSEKELYGYSPITTNNQMELLAVISALNAFDDICKNNVDPSDISDINILTDSKYVLQGATEWMSSWIKNGWKTAAKKPVKNKNLWLQMHKLLLKYPAIKWKWVKGHSGNVDNERVDALARAAIVNKSSNVYFDLS